jgi:hypothetical protein
MTKQQPTSSPRSRPMPQAKDPAGLLIVLYIVVLLEKE